MAARQLSDNNPGGNSFGQSATDLISFYGVTPAAQPASASQAAVVLTMVTAIATATLSQVGTSGKWAFASSTVGNTFKPRINQAKVDITAMNVLLTRIRANLVTLGAIKGAA